MAQTDGVSSACRQKKKFRDVLETLLMSIASSSGSTISLMLITMTMPLLATWNSLMIEGEFIALLLWGNHTTPSKTNGPLHFWNYRQLWSPCVCTCWFMTSWTCQFTASPFGRVPWQFFNTSPTRRDHSSPLLLKELMRSMMPPLLSNGDRCRHLSIRPMMVLEGLKCVYSSWTVSGPEDQ